MNDLTPKQLLLLRAKVKKPFELSVDGISMLPILHPDDSIKVCAKDEYTVGDILVFFYKDDSLLVHRLLKSKTADTSARATTLSGSKTSKSKTLSAR